MDTKNARDPDPAGCPAMVRWLTSFPSTIVAANSLFVGLILSACEAAGWIRWGHEAFFVSIVPVIVWALAMWVVDRQ
jgi:hypothetical protein